MHIRDRVGHIFSQIVVGQGTCWYHPHIRVALRHLALLSFVVVLNNQLRLWFLVHCVRLGFRKHRRLGTTLLLAVYKCVSQGLPTTICHPNLACHWAFQWDFLGQELRERNQLEWLD